MVLFLYRPEYYGITEDEIGNPTQGLAEVVVAKHRNGSLDSAMLRFIGKYTKFTDLEGYSLPTPSATSFDTITRASKANGASVSQD